jgi:hypothetical protein
MDYFSSKKTCSSQLDERDLLDTLPVKTTTTVEMNRITDALNYLSPNDSPSKLRRVQHGGAGGYFSNNHSSSYGSSTLSTPSLESDYSSSTSLSASCSPLSTPLDYSDEFQQEEEYPRRNAAAPTSESEGIASRRKIQLPKLEIPRFKLDASYFTSTAAAKVSRPKPSNFQFDVSPPRRSKTAYSTSLPTNQPTTTTVKPINTSSTSWNPEPIDLVGIMGDRPGSPIRLRQKRRDNGFAF